MAWKEICKPREEGGLSIRDPAMINKASLLSLTWKLLTSSDLWVCFCRQRFLSNGKPKSHYISSSVWSGMKPFLKLIYQHSTWNIGTGEKVLFWIDRWLDRPLVEHWNIPESLHARLRMKVQDYIHNGQWRIPIYFQHKDIILVDKILKIILPTESTHDKLN